MLGMSTNRDDLANMAMHGILAGGYAPHMAKAIAEWSYKMADNMLAISAETKEDFDRRCAEELEAINAASIAARREL